VPVSTLEGREARSRTALRRSVHVPRRSPSPLAALLGFLIPIALVAGIWVGGHPDLLPSGLRSLLVSEPRTHVIDEAVSLIESDYYRKVATGALVNASLDGLVHSLGDRFSNYLDPASYRAFNDPLHGRRFAGVGMDVLSDPLGLRVLGVFPGSPAAAAGVHEGELVVAVNGRSLAGRDSAYATSLIKGAPGTKVTLTLREGKRRLVRTLTRREVAAPIVESAIKQVAGRRLAWISLATFSDGAHGELRRAVEQRLAQHARGIVVDLRENGGGLLTEAVLVASIFVPDGTIVSTDGRTRPKQVYTATRDAISPAVPLVVLVDGNTASAAEIVTAALQDHHRAKVVGTHTYGKGVFQEIQPLSNGGALDITVGEYFTPDGRNLGGGGVARGAGVQPDVIARENPNSTRDQPLDTALRVLASEIR
jgi:carboxyl-terminal processing protease